jgi:hypothetical protein
MKKSFSTKSKLGAAGLLALTALSACSPADTTTQNDSARNTDAATFGKSALLIIGWNTRVEAEPDTISGLVRSHASKCVKAGASECVVMDAESRGDAQSAFGQLRVRAAPVWLDNFRAEVATEIEAKGGRIVSEGLNIDNVSDEARDMSDRERAQRRANAVAPQQAAGNVVDAAAPVVREDLIDATPNRPSQDFRNLQDLRARAKMQELLITYNPKPSLASAPGGLMVAAALRDVGNVMGFAVGGIIYLLAFIIPFGLLALAWRTLAARLPRKQQPIQTTPSIPV